MPVKSILIDSATGQALHSEDYIHETQQGKILTVQTPEKAHGYFKTGTFTVTGTTDLVAPNAGATIELTDLIISFEKKNTGVVTIQFYDGTYTETVLKCTLTDAPVNLAIAFEGRWKAWADASLQVVISGANSIGAVAVGYLKYTNYKAESYSEWNAKR